MKINTYTVQLQRKKTETCKRWTFSYKNQPINKCTQFTLSGPKIHKVQDCKITTSESRLGDNISVGAGFDKSKPSDPGKLWHVWFEVLTTELPLCLLRFALRSSRPLILIIQLSLLPSIILTHLLGEILKFSVFKVSNRIWVFISLNQHGDMGVTFPAFYSLLPKSRKGRNSRQSWNVFIFICIII